MRQEIIAVLQSDTTLMGLLPGGLYDAAEVDEISRQNTPAAFDANRELQACAILMERGPVSLASSTPYTHGASATVEIYFYNHTDGQARERVYDLLHNTRLSSQIGTNWRIEHTDDVLGTDDPALAVPLQMSRYRILVRRR